MAKTINGKRYEKAEVTFNSTDELDVELYNYLLSQSIIIGKSNYLKQLVYMDYQKNK